MEEKAVTKILSQLTGGGLKDGGRPSKNINATSK
jgi:hypothetical protein